MSTGFENSNTITLLNTALLKKLKHMK